MKPFLLALLLLPLRTYADSLVFPVPNTGVFNTTTLILPNSQLIGTTLAGQTLSLDLLFADELIARVYNINNTVRFNLHVNMNQSGFPPQGGSVSNGYLVAANGEHVAMNPSLGRVGGSIFGTYVLSWSDPFDPAQVVDFRGAHFDWSLPNDPSFLIADVSWVFFIDRLNSGTEGIVFGTPAQIPEPVSLLLLGLPAVFLITMKHRIGKKSTGSRLL